MCSSLVQHFTCPRTTARSRSCPDPWSFPRLRSIDPATRVKINSLLHHGVLPFRHHTLHWLLDCWHGVSDFAHFSNFCPDFAIDFDFENNETCAQNAYYVLVAPRAGVSISKQVGIISPVSSWALQIIAGREGGGGQGWRQGAAQLFRTLATG